MHVQVSQLDRPLPPGGGRGEGLLLSDMLELAQRFRMHERRGGAVGRAVPARESDTGGGFVAASGILMQHGATSSTSSMPALISFVGRTLSDRSTEATVREF